MNTVGHRPRSLKPPKPKAVRTTITLPHKVHTDGQDICEQEGFASFSDLCAFLIRIHKGARL